MVDRVVGREGVCFGVREMLVMSWDWVVGLVVILSENHLIGMFGGGFGSVIVYGEIADKMMVMMMMILLSLTSLLSRWYASLCYAFMKLLYS